MAKTKRRNPSKDSWLGRGDLTTSLAFIFPLLLVYEIGVLFSSTVNGVDFVSRYVYAAVGYNVRNYIIAHTVLAVLYLAWVVYLRAKKAIDIHAFLPMLLETAVYALTLGSVIVFVMDKFLGFSIQGGADLALGGTAQSVVTSAGAGVHEELVFRLCLFAGGAALLHKLGLTQGVAMLVALVLSSLVFSWVHHLGPLGDPFSTGVFVYRLLAGVSFALIFYYRSLAHAVYAHFLYDVYVMILRGG